MTQPNKQQVGRAGEHFVAAELHRRGAYAVTFAGNMPGIDVIASNHDQTRTVVIQVKSKTSGTWHSQYTRSFTLRCYARDEAVVVADVLSRAAESRVGS